VPEGYPFAAEDEATPPKQAPLDDISFAVRNPELFFAVVAPIGADAKTVSKTLEASLSTVGYNCREVHLVEQLHTFDRWSQLPELDVFRRYETHMDAGNEFREALGSNDAFALLAAARVYELRGQLDEPSESTAYIFRSLKRPEEVETLRAIYGKDGFFLVAAHAPAQARLSGLERQIRTTRYERREESAEVDTLRLADRDARELDQVAGQRVSDTFPLADFFVDVTNPTEIRQSIDRFIRLLFGYPFHTPRPAEFAMFFAMGAALRSADLGRQVGAVIVSDDDEVLGVGTNEVPKAGGGLYWEGDEPDGRDWNLDYVPSTEMKQRSVGEVLKRLIDHGWIDQERAANAVDGSDELHEMVGEVMSLVDGTELTQVTEYGRSVHAEMASLMYAARKGVSVQDATLYTTTFPCHVCARHIVAAGIKKVVYNEPYPKSLADWLHEDSLAIDTTATGDGRVDFRPFVGIAPRRYIDLFAMGERERKTRDGRKSEWQPIKAQPKLHPAFSAYHRNELKATRILERLLEKASIQPVDSSGASGGGASE
jgi:cytidine deaminase